MKSFKDFNKLEEETVAADVAAPVGTVPQKYLPLDKKQAFIKQNLPDNKVTKRVKILV